MGLVISSWLTFKSFLQNGNGKIRFIILRYIWRYYDFPWILRLVMGNYLCSYDDGYNGMPSSCIKTSLVRVFGIKLIFRVEFQSKFFKGGGEEFVPFSFKNAIEAANA